MWKSGYMKTIFTVLGAILVALSNSLIDDVITVDEWTVLGLAVMNAVTVYVVPNLTGSSATYAKAIVAGLTAVLGSLTSLLVGGVDGADVINIVILFGTAAGVLIAPGPQHALNPKAKRASR